MTPAGAGFLLELVYESFAVRALLGSLAAACLAGLAVRFHLVRSTRARRLVILAPMLVAAAAGVATAATATATTSGGFLPRLWMARSGADAADAVIDYLADARWISLDRVDLLLVGYVAILALLMARRLLGAVAVRRVLRGGRAPRDDERVVVATARRLARAAGQRVPRLLVVERCPGGAFAHGVLRPTVVLDPGLVEQLDDRELEGLVAHELAHLRRADPLTCLVVGVFRDATFFLPTMHVAARWLRREQEESADELAATLTRRPAALASSILKVWERSRADRSRLGLARGPRVACAAVAVPLGLSPYDRARRSPRPIPGARIVTRRIERLIAGRRDLTRGRRLAEVTLAVLVLVVGAAAAIVIPERISEDLQARSVSLAWLPPAPVAPDESPVLAAFRSLTDATAASAAATTADASTASTAASTADATIADATTAATTAGASTPAVSRAAVASGCPCVESQADLRSGRQAEGVARAPGLLWAHGREASHDLRDASRDGFPNARPLWTSGGDGLGVFLVQADS